MAAQEAAGTGSGPGLVAATDKSSERIARGSAANRVVRVFPIRISNASHLFAEARSQKHVTSPEVDKDSSAPPVPSVSVNPTGDDIKPSASTSVPSASNPTPLVSASHVVQEESSSGKHFITTRFSHLSLDDDGQSVEPPAGQKVYRCEDEPIHIPGAIQRFGALIAVRENERGEFLVRIASENTEDVTGFKPKALFDLRCFTGIFAPNHRDDFLLRVRSLREDGLETRQDIFTLSLASPLPGAPTHLFCAMHMNEESDQIVCEFELEHNLFNPIQSLTHVSPDKPPPAIDRQALETEKPPSTPSKSTPLRTVSIARKVSRHLGPMELFSILTEIQSRLSAAKRLPALLDTIVSLVYELTGFHRTMVYQFDENASGCVVSEHIGVGASADTYKGLHFPAADIPKQARELYMINTIRILYDKDQETARLVCRDFEDAKVPLNLKHSYLRAMSPIHLKYLGNMGVQASMSISLMIGGKLWGLVSCHSYGAGVRVSLPVRELCRGLGNAASGNIEKLIYASRELARKPLSAAPRPASSPSAYIAASSSDLLNMFGADFGFLVIKGEARTIGTLLAYAESIVLLHYIKKRSFTAVTFSHQVMKDYADISYSAGLSIISGMLVIPLTPTGSDFLVFFRQGRLKEISWAGNPHEKTVGTSSNYLEPRSSFKRWSETVLGTSREWTEHEVESATILSVLYGRFIEVWRQKEAVVQKNRMTRLLIRNAGHEVRTPLNSIINYLEVALEETLGEPARHHLQKSLQASKSLVFVVNDLLNLTEAEDSDFSVHEDNVDLRDILSEVVAAFEIEAMKRKTHVALEADLSAPWIVICDPGKLRTVISNLLANAIKHSNERVVRVTMEETSTTKTSSSIEISFQDEGTGLSEQQLNNIFQDFERIMDMDGDEGSVQPTKPTEIRRHEIGLGLAITARFVRLNNGQISISSDGEGKGTTVSITFPFRKALIGYAGKRKMSHLLSLPTPPTDPNFSQSNPVSDNALTSPEESISEGSATKGKLVSGEQSNPVTPYEPDYTSSSSFASPMSPNSPGKGRFPFPTSMAVGSRHDDTKLTILVAEDNPLNSQLLETRLRRRRHEIRVAGNGQECFDAFTNSPVIFDVVLMDIQMPLVDGSEATRLIRKFETETSPSISPHAISYGRVPVIAVSASLTERCRDEYVETGFDGWILKPIDFKRLETMLAAIQDKKIREDMQYTKGSWDKGGWFRMSGKDTEGT